MDYMEALMAVTYSGIARHANVSAAAVSRMLAASGPATGATAACGAASSASADARTSRGGIAVNSPASRHEPGWCEMPATAQPAMTRPDVDDAWCEALFTSGLQPADAPTAEMVAEAVSCAVRRFGTSGCAGRMAQEFGDHPDLAARRMRWVRQLARTAARP
jgi:hypothetical protein